MPRRDDLKRIVILGAGPIVIGQACEFDYSGTQGTKALREEGYDVILVNSNPATIMTDPELAHRTYIEPLEPRTLTAILERERPTAILPTLGGQTALNLALDVHKDGTLARLAELYHRDVVFRDPLQTLRGRDAFLAMNRRIMRRARRLSFDVKDAVGSQGSAFLTWAMRYEPRRGPTITFEGSTHARVRDGLVTEQRDYWDLLSSLAESLPVLHVVYAKLAPHLA